MELISLPDIVKLVATADLKKQNNKENVVVNHVHVQHNNVPRQGQVQAQAYYPPAQNYGRDNFRRGHYRQAGRNQRAPYNRAQHQGNGRNMQQVQQGVGNGPKCQKCKFPVHEQGEICPAAGARCRQCQVIGHYKRCCPQRNQVNVVQDDWPEML